MMRRMLGFFLCLMVALLFVTKPAYSVPTIDIYSPLGDGTVYLNSLNPFEIKTSSTGYQWEEYKNVYTETFTDFHFTVSGIQSNGNIVGGNFSDFFSACDSAATSLNCYGGSGIAIDEYFVIEVSGFDAEEVITARPTVDGVAVPEPDTLILLGVGLVSIGLLGRKQLVVRRKIK